MGMTPRTAFDEAAAVTPAGEGWYHARPVGWSPTVELTWHMRDVPAPGPLRVAARCRHVSGGWFDEEAEVWDAAGRLVAQSRQIARLGRSARLGRDA
ncbi:MAG TPA: hypothetical protein DHU96_16510 [Actinobacteria bacterium]|nr:hypothetical protein [Actinomycetota bacterium]